MSDVRVRFAPSPTGYLHIGGARTALYAWLWARQTGGTFVLRIEDTDEERNSEESYRAIYESMTWLGLDWDEGPEYQGMGGGDRGPYMQSERLTLYREYADKLVDAGAAYWCYATKEEIAEARAAHEAKGVKYGFRFESPWRERTDKPDDGRPGVLRLKAPKDGSTAWDDLIKGRIEVPHNTLQDQVLLRPNGMPLYNLACFVDDLTMGINLVARADDHMINTAPQILLYEGLGLPVPSFAHLPLILGANGKKLSKRHASVAVMDYKDQGFLPDGVINYLARLGWSHGDQEIFTRQELIKRFNWEHVGTQGATYDPKKFEHVQSEHLRMLPNGELSELTVPFLAERGLDVDATDPKLSAAIEYIKPRATTLKDMADGLDYFFRDEPEFDEKAKRKFLTAENAESLRKLADVLEATDAFEVEPLEQTVKTWLESNDLPIKVVAQPARVAMTGRTKSPGLFEVMAVLGKDRTIGRLRRGADLAESAASSSST